VEKANAEVMPSSKYAQLLESVEAIPALNESNRVLRQTKEKLEKEIVDINAQLDEAAKSVEPLKQQLREAEERQDKLEAELEAMQGDNQRWRQRANQLIEKNQVCYLTYHKVKWLMTYFIWYTQVLKARQAHFLRLVWHLVVLSALFNLTFWKIKF